MRTCVITYATSRYRNGETRTCQMSRFLRDIDQQYLQMSATSMSQGESFGSARRRWNDDSDNWRDMDWTDEVPTVRRSEPRIQHRPTLSPTNPTTPPPGFKPVSRATAAPASSNGKFTQHTVSELSEGCLIQHERFGQGVVTTIDESGADPKIVVNFNDVGTKTMLLKFAKFQIL